MAPQVRKRGRDFGGGPCVACPRGSKALGRDAGAFALERARRTLADGRAVNWAELALELGYLYQAHFIEGFKALVGVAPATYAKGIPLTTS